MASYSYLIFSVLAPVIAAMLLYHLHPFQPAHMPVHEFTSPPLTALMRYDRMLDGSEFVGHGVLQGPEDIVYDPDSKLIYTGCGDGWIKRIKLNDAAAESVVDNWINTGGRPLGLALRNNQFVVADAYKGLLKIIENRIELLTDEAEGQKFRLTDGLEIAEDGMIYFTDASYKYNSSHVMWDFLEGKPHGRLLSFDPVTHNTRVLLHNLFFANGVTISPDQTYVVYCETTMRRCRKYFIKGKESGRTEKFIENLPGLPDNIHYDGQGLYWIALAREVTTFWDLAFRYPFIRKVAGIVHEYIGLPQTKKNAGVMAFDLEGKPISHYCDPRIPMFSSGNKIGDHLYCGSLYNPFILRLDLNKYPSRGAI